MEQKNGGKARLDKWKEEEEEEGRRRRSGCTGRVEARDSLVARSPPARLINVNIDLRRCDIRKGCDYEEKGKEVEMSRKEAEGQAGGDYRTPFSSEQAAISIPPPHCALYTTPARDQRQNPCQHPNHMRTKLRNCA